jgi:hypothetical protein
MKPNELKQVLNSILVAVHQGDDPLEAIPPDFLADFQEAGDVYETPDGDTVLSFGGAPAGKVRYRLVLEEMP